MVLKNIYKKIYKFAVLIGKHLMLVRCCSLTLMAARKRKQLSVTAAPDRTGSKHETKLAASPAKQKKHSHGDNVQTAERESSHYFSNSNTDLQHRLGEDFFKQPCISLAKALLGKVTLSPHLIFTHLKAKSRY